MSKELIQRTLILFKPDAVQRGIVGEILTRFQTKNITTNIMKELARW